MRKRKLSNKRMILMVGYQNSQALSYLINQILIMI